MSSRVLLALTAVFALGVAVLTSPKADAYHLYGGKWSSASNLVACISNTYSGHNTAWTNAANDWVSATWPGGFGYTSSCSSNQMVMSDLYWPDDPRSGIAGWNPGCCSGNYTYTFGLLNWHFTQNYNSSQKKSIAGHEIGHQLGLDHEGFAVLMNGSDAARFSYGVYTPQTDDVSGFFAIY